MPCKTDPQKLVLPLNDWPPSDRADWDAAFATGDIFEDQGVAAHWRSITRNLVAKDYGRWLGWLQTVGELDGDELPTDRITANRLHRYVAFLKEQNLDTTVTMRLHGLCRALWAMAPEHDLADLRRIIRHLKRTSRNKKDKRPHIHASRRLLELGFELMDEADTFSPVPWKRACRYRDGLIIAFLAARPLRISNFAGLILGETLIETSAGFVILIPPEDSKTHQPIELPVPNALVPQLHTYIDVCRPVLLGDNNDPHLWITKYGKWMRDAAVRIRVCKLTEKAFGVPTTPHLFRDCLATSMAIDDPEHVHAAAILLGHSTLETTTKYYNQATSLTAGRKLTATISDLRKKSIRSKHDRR